MQDEAADSTAAQQEAKQSVPAKAPAQQEAKQSVPAQQEAKEKAPAQQEAKEAKQKAPAQQEAKEAKQQEVDDLFDARLALPVGSWTKTHAALLGKYWPKRGWTREKVLEVFRFWRRRDRSGIEKLVPETGDLLAVYLQAGYWYKQPNKSLAGYYVGDVQRLDARSKKWNGEDRFFCGVAWRDAPVQPVHPNKSFAAVKQQEACAKGKYGVEFDPTSTPFAILNHWEVRWKEMDKLIRDGKAARVVVELDDETDCPSDWTSDDETDDETDCPKKKKPKLAKA